MSTIANWSYTNKADVRPYYGSNDEYGEAKYGDSFSIECTWTASEGNIDSKVNRQQYEIRYQIFTEDSRVKVGDLIRLNGQEEWQEVIEVTSWDMTPFGAEKPDYRIVT